MRNRTSKPQEDVVHVRVPALPRKRPRQARSLAMVDALKQAGRDILETEGRVALSASRLADRSGVAVSSIYEYFPTMESLVATVFHEARLEARRQVIAEIRAMPSSTTLLDALAHVMRTGLAMLHKWSLIDPDLNVRASHYDELVRLDLIKSESLWSVMVAPVLFERFADEIVVSDRATARFLFDHTVQALTRTMMIEKPELLGQPATPIMLARMLHALLTSPHR